VSCGTNLSKGCGFITMSTREQAMVVSKVYFLCCEVTLHDEHVVWQGPPCCSP
jgi:hypothetical protein